MFHNHLPTMQSPSSINPLYSIAEIAALWKVSEKFVKSAIQSGDLRGLRDGKDFKTQAHHIDTWLQSIILTSEKTPVLPETRGRKTKTTTKDDPYSQLFTIGRN